jgi:hypothetical protein
VLTNEYIKEGKFYREAPHGKESHAAANIYALPYRERWHACMQESANIIILIAKSENLK